MNFSIDPESDTLENMLIRTQENTSIWLFTHFQFAILALSFAAVSPFRRPPWTNISFVAYFILCIIGLSSMMLLGDSEASFKNFAELFTIREGVGHEYRVSALYLAATNLILSLTWEVVIVDRVVRRWVLRREHKEKLKEEVALSRKAGCLVMHEDGTGVMGGGGGVGGGGFGGKMKSTLNKLGPRLNMAAALQVARSWSDVRHIPTGTGLRLSNGGAGGVGSDEGGNVSGGHVRMSSSFLNDNHMRGLTGGHGGVAGNQQGADIGARNPFAAQDEDFHEGFDAWKGRRRE
jgi:hypothetical protein